MATLPDVIRSGLRAEDLTGLTPEVRAGLEPLLRYVNNAVQGIAGAFSGQITAAQNLQCEVQTVTLSHGVPQVISLKKLKQAKSMDVVGCGSANGSARHQALFATLTGTTIQTSVKVTAYFLDPAAVRVPVTVRLWPEGEYSAISPAVQPAWITPTFENSWVNWNTAYAAAAYHRDALGYVHLKGLIKNGTAAASAFTLPAGYRPAEINQFLGASYSGAADTFSVIDIASDGTVKPHTSPVGGNVSLSGITFKAEL